MGKPGTFLVQALQQLAKELEIDALSSLYRSQPVGYAAQPDFLNVVCIARVRQTPKEMLQQVHGIERFLGRVRSFRNAPRIMDVDLLDYDGLVLDTPDLTLPHPRLHQRAFVLVPLAEIAPDWRHPVLGKTAAELLAEAGPLERIERIGRLPGW